MKKIFIALFFVLAVSVVSNAQSDTFVNSILEANDDSNLVKVANMPSLTASDTLGAVIVQLIQENTGKTVQSYLTVDFQYWKGYVDALNFVLEWMKQLRMIR